MINCNKQHGHYYAAHVSSDLKRLIEADKKIDDYVAIHYEFDGEIAYSFFISKFFDK